jgi:hypothetical protein
MTFLGLYILDDPPPSLNLLLHFNTSSFVLYNLSGFPIIIKIKLNSDFFPKYLS